MTFEEYIYTYKEELLIERCADCCELTNSCGLYANELNKDIFERYFRKNREDYNRVEQQL